jgi:hypothetical protein
MRVDHDPNQRFSPKPIDAAGKFRIVGQNCAHTREYRIVTPAHGMHCPACLRAGYPFGFTARCRNPAIKGGGKLEPK